ncbi:sugar transferase [Bryobacterales bacterium F-183]|nr:sugar transferase [Bryobacterales bacterium F-183]
MRLKRSLDLTIAVPLFLLLLPALAALWMVIRFRMGSPVIFRQKRGGLGNTAFDFYKLRTMTDERDADGKLLPDSVRLTPLGVWLRRTSLDELPQLWNVIRGDMSLVGPRPLLADYLARYDATQRRRHDVRPGITGWAQINGRNSLSWPEKFALDVWYVEHRSFLLDLQILWRTFAVLFRREGVSHASSATMPEFLGPTKTAS